MEKVNALFLQTNEDINKLLTRKQQESSNISKQDLLNIQKKKIVLRKKRTQRLNNAILNHKNLQGNWELERTAAEMRMEDVDENKIERMKFALNAQIENKGGSSGFSGSSGSGENNGRSAASPPPAGSESAASGNDKASADTRADSETGSSSNSNSNDTSADGGTTSSSTAVVDNDNNDENGGKKQIGNYNFLNLIRIGHELEIALSNADAVFHQYSTKIHNNGIEEVPRLLSVGGGPGGEMAQPKPKKINVKKICECLKTLQKKSHRFIQEISKIKHGKIYEATDAMDVFVNAQDIGFSFRDISIKETNLIMILMRNEKNNDGKLPCGDAGGDAGGDVSETSGDNTSANIREVADNNTSASNTSENENAPTGSSSTSDTSGNAPLAVEGSGSTQ